MLVISGCGGLGPKVIKGERQDYNIAIQRSNNQQLLLNLVRLKYRDTPFFLEVSSIASQFSLRGNASASADLPENNPNVFGLGAGIAVEERPTVTYAPLQGEKFIQRLLSRIPLQTVFLLCHSGWSIERVFRLCLQRLNELKNATGASGPTPSRQPVYREFARACKLFRSLQLRDALEISLGMEKGASLLTIQVRKGPSANPELQELNTLLAMPQENTRFVLETNPGEKKTHIATETRSLLGILYYLSHAIQTPVGDRNKGKVTVTRLSSGQPFDWVEVTGDLLRVRSRARRPDQASVTIHFRNAWFFIDDADLSSKSTFALLSQIFSLQAGKIHAPSPLLTLPVGN